MTERHSPVVAWTPSGPAGQSTGRGPAPELHSPGADKATPSDSAQAFGPDSPDLNIVRFAGTLHELFKLCRRAQPGTIVDLGNATIGERTDWSDSASLSEAAPEVDRGTADKDRMLPFRATAASIDSAVSFAQAGLHSLRLAQVSTDDRSGSRGAGSSQSSSVRPGGSQLSNILEDRPQSPPSFTIAGTPEHALDGDGWGALSTSSAQLSNTAGRGCSRSQAANMLMPRASHRTARPQRAATRLGASAAGDTPAAPIERARALDTAPSGEHPLVRSGAESAASSLTPISFCGPSTHSATDSGGNAAVSSDAAGAEHTAAGGEGPGVGGEWAPQRALLAGLGSLSSVTAQSSRPAEYLSQAVEAAAALLIAANSGGSATPSTFSAQATDTIPQLSLPPQQLEGAEAAAVASTADAKVPWQVGTQGARITSGHGGSTSSESTFLLSTPADALVRVLSQVQGLSSATPERSVPVDIPSSSRSHEQHLSLHARGITLRNGTLSLPSGITLIIEGALQLVGITVSGRSAGSSSDFNRSSPLVFVSQGTVDMRDCTISGNTSGHGVGVGERGVLELQQCKLCQNRGTGILTFGAASSATAKACHFEHNGQDGALAASGATLVCEECTFKHNWSAGVCAAHSGTSVTLTECVSQRNTFGYVGHSGGELKATACSASHNNKGLLAVGAHTSVHADGGMYASNREGVCVTHGAQARITDARVTANTVGCYVAGQGSKLAVLDCRIAQCAGHGIRVLTGAECQLVRGEVAGNEVYGAVVEHSHSKLSAQDVQIVGNGGSGVCASLMAAAELSGCQILSNKISGVHVATEGTHAKLLDCSVVHNGTIGIFVSKGAQARAKGGEVAANGSSGCEVRDRRSSLRLLETKFHENGRVAIYVHSAAAALCKRCKLNPGAGCAVLCGGRSGIDLGGGTVALDGCQVANSERNVVRHGGRIFDPESFSSGSSSEMSAGSASANAKR